MYGLKKVGVPINTVADSAEIASAVFLNSSGDGNVTTETLRSTGYHNVTVNPKLWKIGRLATILSFSGNSREVSICRQLPSMLRCVRITPFGSPELPLVNNKPASAFLPFAGTFKILARSFPGIT